MEVDVVTVLQGVVRAAVGEAGDRREFVPGVRIEVGITYAAIHRGVSGTRICEARRVVGAARNVAKHVPHEIIDALVPFQGSEIIHVGECRALVVGVARNLAATRPGQRGTNV